MEEIRKKRLGIIELPSSHDPSTFQGLAKGTKPASSWTDLSFSLGGKWHFQCSIDRSLYGAKPLSPQPSEHMVLGTQGQFLQGKRLGFCGDEMEGLPVAPKVSWAPALPPAHKGSQPR